MVITITPLSFAYADKLDIETYRNNSSGAYQQALKDDKHAVILFDSEYCGFCKNLANNLTSDVMDKYVSQVVVSVTDGEKDGEARVLEEALGSLGTLRWSF